MSTSSTPAASSARAEKTAATGASPTPTPAPAPASGALARRPLPAYRTVDLVLTVAIGVVFAFVFLAWGQVYTLFTPLQAVLPPSVGLLAGVWFLPALVAMLIVRRPGAAVLAEVIAAVLEMVLGGQWGIGTVVSGLLQGGGVEIAFLVTAYRRFTLPVAIAGGALSGILEWVYERFSYYPEWSWASAWALLGFFIVSGALLCGVLGWLIVRALGATGALSAFPAGRQWGRRSRA
ncbi:ECF transporter S component [Brachybacterium halotolerans subsp. kimchii]|uniref:ECF transporter S component n=1 Tax=Brachybacterium halotolerans TaxID=2795215 RepID=UPI001E29A1A9|nr:ECF transporter S component [Brachybacterium halotolerans]UEJ83563.1 ECF transporter S component [Brachybacterium halotolerans subsp. kimchii]